MARGLPDLVSHIRLLFDDSGARKAQGAVRNLEGDFSRFGSRGEQLGRSLTDVQTRLNQFGPAGSKASSALGGITAGLTNIGPVAGAAAVGVSALVAGVGALAVKGVANFAEKAEEVRDFGRAAGTTAEESSRFVSALDDMQISTEQGASALFKLGKNVADGGAKLQQYGIGVVKAADGTTDLQGTFLNVAEAIASTSDPARRAEIAFAAFGKQGLALIPILEKGRAGIEEMFADADLSFSQEDLDNAEEYRLALDRLEDAVGKLQRSLGSGLVPLLANVADGLATLVEKGDDAAHALDNLPGGKRAGDAVRGFAAFVNLPIRAAEALGLLGGRSKDAASGQDALVGAAEAAQSALDQEAESAERLAAAINAIVGASVDTISAQLSYEDAVEAVSDAERDVADKRRALAEATAGTGESARRAADASRNLAEAQEDAARSAQDAAENIAEAQADLIKAIEDGDRAIAEAHEEAAEQAEDAAERVAEAQKDAAREIVDAAQQVEDAQEAQARAVESAADRVESAERSLAGAQRSAQDAQESLTRARVEAARRLRDLQEQVEDGSRAERAAVIRVRKAEEELALAQRNRRATADDKALAQLALEDAKDALEDLQEKNAELAQEQADAQAAGVEGAANVVAAREDEADAHQRVEDAVKSLAKAQSEAVRTQTDAAKRVAEAQAALAETRIESERRVTDALDAQAEQQIDSAKRIADAERQASEQRVDAEKRVTDAVVAAADAQEAGARRVADAQRALADAHRSASSEANAVRDATEALDDAQRALQDAYVMSARKAADLEIATRRAKGEEIDAGEEAQIFKSHLERLADHIGGPMGERLRQLAQQILDLPDAKQIVIDAQTEAARASFAQMERDFRNTQPITIPIYADTSQAEASFRQMERDFQTLQANASILVPSIGFGLAKGGILPMAASGMITSRPTIVGEDGSGYPEYVIPTNPAHRNRALALFDALGRDLGGSSTVVNVATNANPYEIAHAIAWQQKTAPR